MIFKRLKSEGLAHNSYLIGSEGEAAVIDPRRDCDIFLNIANEKELRIKYIFETHRNEDYVIGSVELAYFTGAEIFHGRGLDWKYGTTVRDGQEFTIGNVRLTVLYTPGHTDESVSYVLSESSSKDSIMVFTGDTLFVDDVGRTDLYGREETARLAGSLYDSIFRKLLPLGDEVILCPAHSGGSICGKSISLREESTIGIERKRNPILQMREKEVFIKYKVEEKHERPPYFQQMEKYNLEGPPLLKSIPLPPSLTSEEFKDKMSRGAVVIDTRMPPAFGGAHIKGSYSIWLEGLPSFTGWILPYNKPVLFVLEDIRYLEKAVRYLVRLGFDQLAGYLKGGIERRGAGIEGWYELGFPIEHLGLLDVHELKRKIDAGEYITVLDVRGETEWQEGHIEGALHLYVGHLENRLYEVPHDKTIVVYCSVGDRASLGASILLRAGFKEVFNLLGGSTAWILAGYPVTTKQ